MGKENAFYTFTNLFTHPETLLFIALKWYKRNVYWQVLLFQEIKKTILITEHDASRFL